MTKPQPGRPTLDHLANLTAGDLMTSGVVSLGPTDTIGHARELILGLGIGGLPVVDQQGVVTGFVSSSDLVEEWAAGEPVETIMSKHLHTVDVEATIVQTAQLMVAAKIHHLVVTRHDHPVGLLSTFDLVAAIAHPPLLTDGP